MARGDFRRTTADAAPLGHGASTVGRPTADTSLRKDRDKVGAAQASPAVSEQPPAVPSGTVP